MCGAHMTRYMPCRACVAEVLDHEQWQCQWHPGPAAVTRRTVTVTARRVTPSHYISEQKGAILWANSPIVWVPN